MNVKSYEAKLTSWLRNGNNSYGGFNVLKKQKYFHRLQKIREATFYLPTKTGVPFVLKTCTTPSYHRACTEIRFKGKALKEFHDWLDSKIRGIDWPRNNFRYYEATVIPQNGDDSKVEIRIKGEGS